MIRRSVIAAVAGLLLAAGSLLVVSPAYAVPTGACYHDTCTAQDPYQTFNQFSLVGCGVGEYGVRTGYPPFGGTLRLRWGPNCETNWTKFTPADNNPYQIEVTRLADGVSVGDGYNPYQFSSGSGVVHWTDQIYSPGPAKACVQRYSHNQWSGWWCVSQ
jgi:hypothetical protein